MFTTPGTVEKMIPGLAKNKASSVDQITNLILKFLPETSTLTLTKIIND